MPAKIFCAKLSFDGLRPPHISNSGHFPERVPPTIQKKNLFFSLIKHVHALTVKLNSQNRHIFGKIIAKARGWRPRENRPVTQFTSVYSRSQMAVDTRYAYEAGVDRYVSTVNIMSRVRPGHWHVFRQGKHVYVRSAGKYNFPSRPIRVLAGILSRRNHPRPLYIARRNYANSQARRTRRLMEDFFVGRRPLVK